MFSFGFQRQVSQFMFSGSQYYRYRNKTLEEGFPKRISQGFSGIPAYLAAAVVHDEKIYFIKKSRYYIFAPSVSPPVKGLCISISSFSPSIITITVEKLFCSDSEKLPDGISNAMSGFKMDNKIFIFSKEKYWRMNTR